MNRWKYFTIKNPSKLQIDTLGEEGWELVSIANNGGSVFFYFYKRPFNQIELDEYDNKTKEENKTEEDILLEQLQTTEHSL